MFIATLCVCIYTELYNDNTYQYLCNPSFAPGPFLSPFPVITDLGLIAALGGQYCQLFLLYKWRV